MKATKIPSNLKDIYLSISSDSDSSPPSKSRSKSETHQQLISQWRQQKQTISTTVKEADDFHFKTDDTEDDKRKFFEAMGEVDYGNIDYQSSEGDSLVIDQEDWLKDLVASNFDPNDSQSEKDDKEAYSLSFESVTDLHDQKYTGITENNAKDNPKKVEIGLEQNADGQNLDIESHNESNLNSIALSASDLSSEIPKPSVNSIILNAIGKTQPAKEVSVSAATSPIHPIDKFVIDSGSDLVPVGGDIYNLIDSDELPVKIAQIQSELDKNSADNNIFDKEDVLVEGSKNNPQIPSDLDKKILSDDLIEVVEPLIENVSLIDEKSIEASGTAAIISRPKDDTPYLKFSDLMALNQEQSKPHSKQQELKPKIKEKIKPTSAGKIPIKKVDVKTVKKTALQKINQKTQEVRKGMSSVESQVKSKPAPKDIKSKGVVKTKVIDSKTISKDSKSKDRSMTKDINHDVENAKIVVSPVAVKDSNVAKGPADKGLSELQHVFDAKVYEEKYLNSTIAQLNKQLEETFLINKNLDNTLELKSTLLESKETEITNLLAQIQFLESLEHISELPKNESEQEILIRGYQTENEKLYTKTKELKNIILETEQRHYLKLQEIKKENMMLKTEMEMKPKKIDINETKYKVENEELKEKIEELKHVIECRDEDINSQKFKYDAIINELNTKSEKLKVENVEIAYEVKGEEYIVELESKLEWYIDNQESFTDLERRIKKYEKAIQEFNQLLDTTIPSDSQNRDVKDVYRIKVLEAQVEDLKDEIKSRFREVPDLKTVLGKPRPFDVDVKVLKKRIYELENEKLDLRKSIQEFQVEGGFDEKVISKAVVDGLLEEETRLKKRIKELEALSETQTNLNNQLITEKHELVNHLSQKIHDQTQTIKSLEINRKHLDTQAQNLKTENTKVESQTQTQPQTQTQSQTLKTQNIKLEINLEKMKEENESLKLRIELLLSSRKTMQKNTLEILKQTQQQNSEIQIKYSEKTLSILKKEWANELKLKLGFRKEKYQQIIDSLSMKVKTLGKALVKKDEEIDCLEKDIDKLTDEYNTVNTIHKGCARFNTQLPPDIEEYDVLLQKIDSLEVEQQNREHKFLKNEKMWEGYQKKMGEKERELKGFQREITELIGIIGGLRKTSQ